MNAKMALQKQMKKGWIWCLGAVLALCLSEPVSAAEAGESMLLAGEVSGKENRGFSEDDTDEDDNAGISEGDIETLTEGLLSELNLNDVDDVLAENEDTEDLSFSGLVSELLDDDRKLTKTTLLTQLASLVFGELAECKSTFIQILLLTAAFAFFNSFIRVFENSQISRTGFYMCFLVLMALLMKSYLLISDLFLRVMDQTVEVMRAMIPAFCMTMVFSSARTTAAAFYQITIVVIYLVERLLASVIVPCIHIFVILQMLNSLTGEKMISRFTALLKTVILWSFRVMLAGVTGMNVIENMIAPSVDNLKKMSVTKALGMIPGLGGVTEAASSIFLGGGSGDQKWRGCGGDGGAAVYCVAADCKNTCI